MIRGRGRGWWAAAALATALAVAGGTPTTAGTAATVPATSPDRTDDARRSDAWLADAAGGLKAGCSAAAAINGVVEWAAAQGLADIDTNRSLTTTTRFDIADVGAQFTATAVLLLAEDGRLQLTDPLSGHLSGLPGWADQVTVGNLLHQNSGAPAVEAVLPSSQFSGVNPATEQDALDLVKWLEPRFAPGAFFEDNDTNYLLLAEVVQAVSGQSLPDFLRARVFAPSGIDIAVRPQPPGDVATEYETVLGQLQPSRPRGFFLAGRGLMFATPSELAIWADNYRTGAVGGPDLVAAATRDAVPIGPDPGVPSYGAGIYVLADGSLELDGPTSAGFTYFAVSPDRHAALAVSCNQQNRSELWESRASALRQIWFATT